MDETLPCTDHAISGVTCHFLAWDISSIRDSEACKGKFCTIVTWVNNKVNNSLPIGAKELRSPTDKNRELPLPPIKLVKLRDK